MIEPTARSSRGSRTLAREYYTSAEIYELEQERVFARRWLATGHVSQLARAGDYYLFEIGDESLIVVRDDGGEIRAFYNVCRHRGSRICSQAEGRFVGGIQCPYHAWTYTLAGKLRGAPNMRDVASFAAADYPLHAVPAELWEGLVFVSLADAPSPFAETFAPLRDKFSAWRLPELRSARREVYDVAANWKLLFQNFSECYHCPSAHPLLNRLSPFQGSMNDLEEGPFLGGPMRLAPGGGSMSMTGEACAPPLGGVSGEDLRRVHYYTLYPNLFLSLHPDYVLVHRVAPQAVGRTRIVCDWYFHPDAMAAPDFDPGGAVEFWDLTNRQDWELCAISQQGVRSRAYTPGPYADLESQLAAFDREYLRSIS